MCYYGVRIAILSKNEKDFYFIIMAGLPLFAKKLKTFFFLGTIRFNLYSQFLAPK